MPGGESAQPGACTGEGEERGGHKEGHVWECRGGNTGLQPSHPSPSSVNPPGLLKQAGRVDRWGAPSSHPAAPLNASGQAQHLQSLENHAPFPERKAKCKSPSQTHICSSAARKVAKALISELEGRDKYISSTPGAEEENINSGITPAATEISPSLAVIQKHHRFLGWPRSSYLSLCSGEIWIPSWS